MNVADETPPAEPAPTSEPLAPRHRRSVVRIIVTTQLLLALLTATVVVMVYNNLSGNLQALPGVPSSVDRPEEMDFDGPKKPLNILVMGSDSREGEGNDIDGQTGLGARSDTTLLLHVSADRKDAYGVSLPRDAIVDRPDCAMSDGETVAGEEDVLFNTAFSVGGPLCTIQMVEKLTDIRVNHYVTIDFNGFKDMVDAVKGVEVCIPKEVNDPQHDIFLDAGRQTLTGPEALNYVRERTVLSVTGDIGRMKRQQAFIASMVNKVISAGTLSRPDRVYRFLDAATESLYVDQDLDSLAALVDLARQFQDTGLTKIKFITVPIEEYELDANRLVWTDAAKDLWRRMRNDLPLGKNFAEDSLSADESVGTPSGGPSEASGERAGEQEDDAERLANGLCA